MKNKKRVRIGKQPMFRSVKRTKKKVEVKKEIPKDLPHIQADQKQIQEIFF